VFGPHAASSPGRAEAFQSIAVQVEVVAARKPDHQVFAGFQPEAQGAPAEGDLLDLTGEVLVVAVAFAAAFATALQLFPRVEYQVELRAAAGHFVHALRGHEAVQVFERAQPLVFVPQQRKPMLAGLR